MPSHDHEGRETQRLDKKSLRLISGKSVDWSALAATCVCFANASGGCVRIGIEDDDTLPPLGQRIGAGKLDELRKRIAERTVNVQVAPELLRAENGGEFIALHVAPSTGVASTSDGRYFVRVGDSCRPVVGDDVLRLLSDRPGSPWETMSSLQVPAMQLDTEAMGELLAQLRGSERVKASVKEKSDQELLAHYGLLDGNSLTNLGVLMLGTAYDRARLGSAPQVQVIKYDENEQKINKWLWDDYSLSPTELVDAIWQDIPDFRESYELPDGLLRQNLPAYDERVIRELLVNALVHRPYTQRGDIFVKLFPDRLEVVNPGRLPLGVTPENILHASRRRNERMATLFHDLKRMEKEGSGFDLMFEVQLSQGRPAPTSREGDDWVCVTVGRRIIHPEAVRVIADADARFQLRPRERISLGLLLASEGLTGRELAAQLELSSADEVRAAWLGRLLDLGLIQSSGKTQALRYFVNPALLKGSGLEGKTTLKHMAPHRLRALVLEDLARFPGSSSADVHRRSAPELAQRTVRRALEELMEQQLVRFKGERRWRRYWVAHKGQMA